MSDNIEEGNITKTNFGQSNVGQSKSVLDNTGFNSNNVVSARGTEDGLVIRIDGRAEWNDIQLELEEFLGGRKKFFATGQVSIEWLERLPTKEQSKELEDLLINRYGLSITHKKRKSFKKVSGGKIISKTSSIEKPLSLSNEEIEKLEGDAIGEFSDEDFGQELLNKVDSLTQGFNFDDISSYQINPEEGPIKSRTLNEELRKQYINRVTEIVEEELIYDGEANAKVVVGTLRSGQKVETPFSLIVLGDVNPGADLTAGGDIIVLGNLRGTAHAGAYDDKNFDKIIIALQMQPVQLRIGSIISRGNSEKVSGAEVARIDNRRIVVESYNPRSLPFRKKAF